MLQRFSQDVVYAWRVLRRSRGSTAATVLTLALGIGTATVTASIVNAVLLNGLPVADESHLVVVHAEDAGRTDPHVGITFDVLSRLRSVGSLTAVSAFLAPADPERADPVAVRIGDRLTSLSLTLVYGSYFSVLGVVPVVGRILGPTDAAAGAPAVALLSYLSWHREFGGRPDIVGRSLFFRDRAHTVVGVAPRGFSFPKGTDVWSTDTAVFAMHGDATPDDGYFDVIARLGSGMDVRRVAPELTAVSRNADSPRLGSPETRRAVVRPLSDVIVGDIRAGLVVLAGAVALLLLIVWVNVSGLLLTRGLARESEFAIRSALGAGRRRLVAQMMTEHALLAAMSGLLGTLVGSTVLALIASRAPAVIPRSDEIGLDGETLVVALAVTGVSTLAVGVAPALLVASRNLASALRGTSRALTPDRRHGRAQEWIVGAQVALSLVVMIGATLLGRSLIELRRVELGFEPARLLFVILGGGIEPSAATATPEEQDARDHAVIAAFADRAPGIPGIVGATAAYALPFSGAGSEAAFFTEGMEDDDGGPTRRAALYPALDDFASVLGLQLVRGRTFGRGDGPGALPVVVVSTSFAARAWPGEDALGKRIRVGRLDSTWRTVVGVVRDMRYRTLTELPTPAIYRPLRQDPNAGNLAVWVLRTTGEPTGTLGRVRQLLREADPNVGIQFAASGQVLLDETLARPRLLTVVSGALSLVSALLVAVGLFGTLASSVRQQSHSIAIRMALGASPRVVRSMVYRRAVVVLGGGMLGGMLLALAGARSLGAVLVGVGPVDATAVVASVVLLLLVAVAATAIPLRRAGRVDPIETLRSE